MEILLLLIGFGFGGILNDLSFLFRKPADPTFTADPPPHPGSYGVVWLQRVPGAGEYWSKDTDSPQRCDGWALSDGHLLPDGGQPVAWVAVGKVEEMK